ncbi:MULTISPECIES: hypothetical protein [unclassified Microbacterium]|uniref:hypothetical protein n=1 Tax=unclassified Microbacterium TaxID=2609290 RepID=UPI003C2D978A
MSALDSRPPLTHEIVVKHVTGSGVTVVAVAQDEAIARKIAKSLESVYGRGVTKVREVAS